MCPARSASSAMCGRSCPAGRARRSPRRPAPSLPIRRGRAGAGLLAHVLVAKYCDHLPLHRQAEIYAREDIDLSRSTLADMVGQAARLVRPLVDALARTSWPASACMPTTPWCRCWSRAWAAPARPDCGPMCATTGRSAAPIRRPCSTATRRTARASTRGRIWRTSAAFCRPMAMPDLPGSTATAGGRGGLHGACATKILRRARDDQVCAGREALDRIARALQDRDTTSAAARPSSACGAAPQHRHR